MTLPLRIPYSPMEALSVETFPVGPEWQYEPKWDGFLCLAFCDGPSVELQSKASRALTRYARTDPAEKTNPMTLLGRGVTSNGGLWN